MAFASNQTSNYGLCQWESSDLVVHSDFNEDNQKIDAALKDLEDNKAEQSELDSLTSTVNGKASSSTVSSLSSRVSSLESGKASVSSVNSVAADVEDLSAACAMVVTGSYTGNSLSGSGISKTLTFTGLNRVPKLVVVRQEDETTSDALVLINGMTGCMSNLSGNYSSGSQVSISNWALNTVTWYASSDRTGMNVNGKKYRYFAVG